MNDTVEPFPPTTAKFRPAPGTAYLIRVWGKEDAGYDPSEPPYVLIEVFATTEKARAYKTVHGRFPDEHDDQPHEGDHDRPFKVARHLALVRRERGLLRGTDPRG